MDDLLELTGRAEATHFWFRGFRKFVAPVLADLADGRPGLRLVDCGCGTGHNMHLLRPHGTAVGFDLSEAGPARAHATGLTVLRGDVTRIPLGVGDASTSRRHSMCCSASRPTSPPFVRWRASSGPVGWSS